MFPLMRTRKGQKLMYDIHSIAPFNLKLVSVKLTSGKEVKGVCHVYSELDDEYDKFINYIVVGTSSSVDLADIAEITEI